VTKTREMRIGVTGSNGYLGSSLVASLRSKDLEVIKFRRQVPEDNSDPTNRQLGLDKPIDVAIFEDISCLVHTAWDLRETDPRNAWERNVEGSKRILEAAREAGVDRFIFLSSMSAYFGTKQDYGLMKLAVERAVLESHQVVVRPGLVYGGTSGGMASTLAKLARLPVIPVFPGAEQFTLHIDDFLQGMTTLIVADVVPSSVIGLAHEPPTPFKEIMLAFAPDEKSSAKTISVPWHPLLGVLRFGERLRVPLPVRSDSLLGLVRPAHFVPGRDIANGLGLSFRPFNVAGPLAPQVE
jgi:nucleoside-diphosphate-sugar epimerase